MTNYEQAKQARTQYINNCEMVSGCWSIEGAKFCEAAGLDYDKAKEAEDEENARAVDEEADKKIIQAAEILGRDLTEEEQNGVIIREIENAKGLDFEGWAFWRNILEQIKEKAESYKTLSEHLAKSLAESSINSSRLYLDEFEYNAIADYLSSCEPTEEDAELIKSLGYDLEADFNIALYWNIETSEGLYMAYKGNTKAEALEQFELFKQDEAGQEARNAKAENAYISDIEYLND